MSTTKKLSTASGLKQITAVFGTLISLLLSAPALAQATSRQCDDGNVKDEQAGPACLLSHEGLGRFNVDSLYWSLDKYLSVEAAQQDRVRGASVIKAFGSIWLFTVGAVASSPLNGEHIAQVGPISIEKKYFLRCRVSQIYVQPGHDCAYTCPLGT